MVVSNDLEPLRVRIENARRFKRKRFHLPKLSSCVSFQLSVTLPLSQSVIWLNVVAPTFDLHKHKSIFICFSAKQATLMRRWIVASLSCLRVIPGLGTDNT
jgi:hypothetical protein